MDFPIQKGKEIDGAARVPFPKCSMRNLFLYNLFRNLHLIFQGKEEVLMGEQVISSGKVITSGEIWENSVVDFSKVFDFILFI